jgi:glycosyltransferase involved in cell wall biosynthesis
LKRNKNKILILPSWYPPDGGGFFKDHAEALHSKNFEVDVLVNRVLGVTSHSLFQIVDSRRYRKSVEGPLSVFRSGYFKWPLLEKRNLKGWVNKYLDIYKEYRNKNGDPAIIIAHSTIWAGYVAARIKELYNIPYILVEHRSRFARDVEAAQKMIREWYFPYIRSSLVKADKVITVSKALDNQLISISPGIRNKIATIPNLIDTDFFTLPDKKRDKEPFIIISFGILEYVKGFDILIRAFAKFVEENEGEFFLRIGGRGTKYRKLHKLARELGVGDRVSLHGYVPREEVKREMQLANLFILPSRFEAFGVVLIEAMATGCPVISTYSGGPEYIVKESDGLLVEPENISQLKEAISEIYNNYEKFSADDIRKDVVENYTKEVIRDNYHQIIRDILNEKSVSSK